MRREEKVVWTYDSVFFQKDGSSVTQRGRYEGNEEALRMAHFTMNFRGKEDVIECHVYSIVRRSKILIAMLEPAPFNWEEEINEPVEVWRTVKEKKTNGWTVKWEGSKIAIAEDDNFILLDEDKAVVLMITFVGDAFDIHTYEYGDYLRVDPLNTTITFAERERNYDEDDEE